MRDRTGSAEQLQLGSSHQDQVYDDGYLRVEHNCYYAAFKGSALLLSRAEFLILSGLVRRIGRVVPSEALWIYVWGDEKRFNAEALRVYVCNLRKKIMPFGITVKSMVSVGYSLSRAYTKTESVA